MKFFWKYIFAPLYGLVVYATIRLLLDSVTGMKFWRRSLRLTLSDVVASVLFSCLFLAVFKRMLRWFDKKWSANDLSSGRILREVLFLILLNLVFQNALLTTYDAFTDDGLQWYDLVDVNTIPLLYSL